MGGGSYEQEFAAEIARAKTGKAKATPWGSGYGKAPEILHGVLPCMLLLDIRACSVPRRRQSNAASRAALRLRVLAAACACCRTLCMPPAAPVAAPGRYAAAPAHLHGGLFVLSHAASASPPRR